jgi:26S proteasome regulatory subunit N6
MAPANDDAKRIEEAQKLAKGQPQKAEAIYREVLAKEPGSNEAAIRNFETALTSLGELYRDNKKVNDLAELIKTTRSTLSSFAKAKTAKLGKTLADIPCSLLTMLVQSGSCSTCSARSPTPSTSRSR